MKILLEDSQSRILFHRIGQSLSRSVSKADIRQAQRLEVCVHFQGFEKL